MTIQAVLDELHDQIADCRLTAFGDVSAGLILRHSARENIPREVLDRIADAARCGFEIYDALELAPEDRTDHPVQTIVSFTPDQTLVLARSGDALSDLTCAALSSSHVASKAADTVQKAAATIGDADR